LNFLDKVAATEHTARALTARGLAFVAASKLHHQTTHVPA
jgi:hypothetical protein